MAKGLDNIIGLADLKDMARRDIIASRRLKEQFPHTGLFGSGGTGKTFFTNAMAIELDYYFFHIEGSTVSSKNDLNRLMIQADLEAIQDNRPLLFFVDECHRLGRLQEVLYYPLANRYIITSNGDRHILAPFTLFAATTHPNMLLPSFLTRLSNTWYLHPYETHQIQRMIHSKFHKWGLSIPPNVSWMVSERCLGIPRLANNLSLKIRNEVVSSGLSVVTEEICEKTFRIEGIDSVGLRRDHREYLLQLFYAEGAPKGIGAIAGKIGLDIDVVEGNVEPVLLNKNFIDMTARGRVITKAGILHLKNIGIVD